jgi:slime mold repeat-containing protein
MANRKLPVTLRCTGLFLIVLGALALAPAGVFAQVHTTGLPVTKSCPPTADPGTQYNCTFTVNNADDQHGVINLLVQDTNPFPGGTPVTIDCLQGGLAVTTLGAAGSGTESCGGTIPETAPFNCSGTNAFNQDQVAATGNDADTGQFAGLPVSGSATNNTLIPPLVCDDGLFCTDDSCSTETGCVVTPHSCADASLCTTDSCDEAADTCVNAPVICNDGNACTIDQCDPATGSTTVCLTTPVVCDDGLFCTDDACDPNVGCTTSAHDCSDASLCTTDSCDEAGDTCVNTPVVCNDGNACTTDTCDPATGSTTVCLTTPVVCDDGLFCTDDACDPKTGCTTSAHDCSDGSLCTADSCDEAGDTCVNAPVVCDSDSNACNGTEECDPATGTCHSVNPPPPCVSDGNACNGPEACDPATGQCLSGPPVVCNDDGNACNGPEVCDPTDGSCDSGPELVCDDGLFCTDDSCDPATGCTTTAHVCNDNDICTDDSCNEELNRCDFALDETNDPSCVEPTGGRMTGGGSIFTKAGGRVTHGFELHCDVEVGPNNLEINWGGGNHFHLTELQTAVCTDDPLIAPRPPSADFDTYTGTGTGSCNGVDGATITFVLTDAGEPGKLDFASFEITGCPGGLTLSVNGNLNKGNQQAHKN